MKTIFLCLIFFTASAGLAKSQSVTVVTQKGWKRLQANHAIRSAKRLKLLETENSFSYKNGNVFIRYNPPGRNLSLTIKKEDDHEND